MKYDVHNNGKIELYNIKDDESERFNLADAYPEKVSELDSLMRISRTESDLFKFE